MHPEALHPTLKGLRVDGTRTSPFPRPRFSLIGLSWREFSPLNPIRRQKESVSGQGALFRRFSDYFPKFRFCVNTESIRYRLITTTIMIMMMIMAFSWDKGNFLVVRAPWSESVDLFDYCINFYDLYFFSKRYLNILYWKSIKKIILNLKCNNKCFFNVKI